ncbi:transcriptional regulator with XRE-family HTH domain [Actinoplanes lutulentus]|uniref:Helix-turn-helix protein n=1 Tax=Actinoplanes lutulentus TaxID=1287878 RepID=A0A327Z6Y9_9ACTN|nr:helix-turn-helix transcriptional regulator [Actinoplanes lutulentus]MBB2949138.1 transcriptional regulator with XRE-family HTH domain [Actinoplanes lutulentus]RAK31459.1 helix-turn-helix protein [Actinoplanes lutulentus]
MTGESNLLGAFLRSRRELVSPEQAGVPVTGVRRVPGLRREEVAMLAGISADYYLRLERGRDRSPSVQVLESLARVLHLDDTARDYLLKLAGDKPRKRRPRREVVPPSTAQFVAMLPFPAFVEGRYLDVLVANPLATALSPRLSAGGNRLRDVFLDPGEQAMWPDWESAAAALVASFRQAVGTDTDDPRVIELVGELSLSSPLFRRLWARHDVRPRVGAMVVPFLHPQVGELRLNREKLLISGTDGIMLVVYHPDPASTGADKLSLLASATLPTTRSEPHATPGPPPPPSPARILSDS